MRISLTIACLVAAATPARATEAGLDVGWVVANGAIPDSFDAVASTGVDWVRINFRLDAWNGPGDATPHGPDHLTYFEAYDRVIDAYLARGFQVYGLLNDESVAEPNDQSDAWIGKFVGNAVAIVDHFKNRVRTWEVINEPNDYAGGSSARITPERWAKILQDTYLAVKHDAGHAGDRCWQVDLVSGPLLSLDVTTAADYLAQAYTYGRAHLAWDYTHEATGSYPLDGIGYHLYVQQGSGSTTDDVYAQMQTNLGAVWSVITQHDTQKPLWISEYGFRADLVGAVGQADRLERGFAAMRDFGHVALAVYFTLRDFPDNQWGVFDGSGARRPSADRLAAVSGANPRARWAVVTHVTAPALRPGDRGDVVLTIENRGGDAWGDGIRLGAASGCPDATTTNAIGWAPSSGYAHSATDARVFLPGPVPPGGSIELHVPVQAPDQEGTYAFGARMVAEGVEWFGGTATAQIVVARDAPAPGDPNDQGGTGATGMSGDGGGCNAGGGGLGGGLALALLAFAGASARARGRVTCTSTSTM